MPRLGEIMTTEVFTTGPDATIAAAAEAMVKGRFGSAVVTRGSMIVGIFTERDALRAAAAGVDASSEPVSRWMTPDPVSGHPDLDSDEAAEIMLAQGFRHLPVVADEHLVGIVSLRDLLGTRLHRA